MSHLIDRKSSAKKLLIPLLAIGGFALFAMLVAVLSTPKNQPNILVTEILASNRGVVADLDGDYPDFIELYNAGKSDVNLLGWFLSDNSNRPMRWVIPDVALKPGEYAYFFASGKDKRQADGVWHTNFSIAANGTEQVILTMPDGTVHQQIGPIEAVPNVSYGLDEKFLYYRYMSEPTPGAANVPPFYDDLQSVAMRQEVVLITEYMTQNISFFPDENGLFHDWVEFHNPGADAVALDGWYLSDSPGRPDKWRLPEGMSIPAGGYLALHCSGLDLPGHVPFRLSGSDGILRLSDYNRLMIDEIALVDTPPHASYGRLPDGAGQGAGFGNDGAGQGVGQGAGQGATQDATQPAPQPATQEGFFSVPTPNAPTTETPTLSLSELAWRKPTVLIMEYMSNNTILMDEDGDTSDWAELYNYGGEPVDLSEMYLSDSGTSLEKWNFPRGFALAPGERIVIWLSSKDRHLHANFSLSERDDGLFLSDKHGRIIDSIEVAALPQHVSAGRDENDFGQWLFFPRPTPGEPNATIGFAELAGLAGLGLMEPAELAELMGLGYAELAELTWLAAATAAAAEPAPVRAMPPQTNLDDIVVEAGALVSLRTGESGGIIRYTLDGGEPTESSRTYDEPIAINKNTVLRARVFAEGKEPSAVLTRTYLVGAVHDVPIVTLAADPAGMFSEATGIYAQGPGWVEGEFPYKGANYWKDWERAAHFAYYTEDNRLGVEIDAGVKIHGQFSRALSQKSFAVFFRNEYGISRLAYPLIPDIDRTLFDALILRSGGQDLLRTKVREAFIHNSVVDVTNVVAMAARPVAVYINGEYWGLYNLREKHNEDYFEINEGIPDDEIDIIKANRNALAGSYESYVEMVGILGEMNEMARMNTDEAYAYADAHIDLDNWIDYWIAVTFFGNPDTGNIKCYKQQGEGHKWRWILFDQDYGAAPMAANPFDNMLHPEGHGFDHLFSTVIARSLMNNDRIKQRFLERYAELMETVLDTDRLLAIFDDYVAQVEAEMPLHIDRWGAPASMVAWEGHLNQTRSFIKMRAGQMQQHIKGTFALSDEEMVELFGG